MKIYGRVCILVSCLCLCISSAFADDYRRASEPLHSEDYGEEQSELELLVESAFVADGTIYSFCGADLLAFDGVEGDVLYGHAVQDPQTQDPKPKPDITPINKCPEKKVGEEEKCQTVDPNNGAAVAAAMATVCPLADAAALASKDKCPKENGKCKKCTSAGLKDGTCKLSPGAYTGNSGPYVKTTGDGENQTTQICCKAWKRCLYACVPN